MCLQLGDYVLVGRKVMEFFVLMFYLILVTVHVHECFEAGRKLFDCENVAKMMIINDKKERNATMITNQKNVLEKVQPQSKTENPLANL